jgi:hypothetical protein
MLSFLFSIIKTGFFTVLLNDYLQRNFPEKYNELCISFSYELIHLYSKGQLLYKKTIAHLNTNPKIKELINKIYKKNPQKNEICQFKDDYTSIVKYYTDIAETYLDHDKSSLYIYSDNENSTDVNTCVNKVLMHSQPFSSKYEVSNIHFLLVEVNVNENKYKINLKTDDFNYYIVDNVLDLKFFKYYLHNYNIHKFTDEERNQILSLKVKVIDQNVAIKEIEVTEDRFIIIKKDDYIY